jgi:hypothetical protein
MRTAACTSRSISTDLWPSALTRRNSGATAYDAGRFRFAASPARSRCTSAWSSRTILM